MSPMMLTDRGWAGPCSLVSTGVKKRVYPVHLYVGAVDNVTSHDLVVGTAGLGGSILSPSPYLHRVAGILTALMLARTHVKSLNLKMDDIVNIMVGTLENSTVSSPSVSELSQMSALVASSAVMMLTKMKECATHLEITANIAVTTIDKTLEIKLDWN